GDELHFSSVGFGLPDQVEDNIFGEWTITGGTGRFANATGSGTYAGTVFVDTGNAHFTLDGVISGFGGPGTGGKRDFSD
ncbi:MAG: hypothetical protein OEN01_08675, partial [Candidatus Krumholzibacteria bacterium]|nr:hypothetical protein [Candidatus Krumholzibacteria bacterium]